MKKWIALLLLLTLVCLTACGTPDVEQSAPIKVAVITGPTGISAAPLWHKSDLQETEQQYEFTAIVTPDAAIADISSGAVDFACVSTNLASKLYKKTSGGIQVLCVNTLGVLQILVPSTVDIQSIEDLRGKTVYTTGKGSNPEYIIEHLLRSNQLDSTTDLQLEYVSEGSNLLSVWQTEPDAVIIAPEPVASSILKNYAGSKVAFDLNDAWAETGEDASIMMGCVIARTEYIQNNPQVVKTFLKEYKASVESCTANVEDTAAYCEEYGIVAKAAIAKLAIPRCHLVYVDGEQMKTQLSDYLNALYEIDPTSIGAIPDANFYYAQ